MSPKCVTSLAHYNFNMYEQILIKQHRAFKKNMQILGFLFYQVVQKH